MQHVKKTSFSVIIKIFLRYAFLLLLLYVIVMSVLDIIRPCSQQPYWLENIWKTQENVPNHILECISVTLRSM